MRVRAQILLMCLVCGVIADFTGAPASEGVFVGALLSMSSTAVVIKCLSERNGTNALYGQVPYPRCLAHDLTAAHTHLTAAHKHLSAAHTPLTAAHTRIRPPRTRI